MPKALHRKLTRQYKKKGLSGEKLDHAVYGTMAKIEKESDAHEAGEYKGRKIKRGKR